MRCDDRLRDTAGNQFAQHGVQTADNLRAAAAQVPVALGPCLRHRCMIIGPDLPDTGRAQWQIMCCPVTWTQAM